MEKVDPREQGIALCIWYKSKSLEPNVEKKGINWHDLCHNVCDGYDKTCQYYYDGAA